MLRDRRCETETSPQIVELYIGHKKSDKQVNVVWREQTKIEDVFGGFQGGIADVLTA